MKKIFCFLSLLFIFFSCQQNRSQEQTTYLIQPESAIAHKLCLSAEDIVVLTKHRPQVIEKIQGKLALSLSDVIDLHEVGLTANTMIQILGYTKSRFQLTSSDIIKLQAEGVPYKVINYLICT